MGGMQAQTKQIIHKTNKSKAMLKCLQINLHHSRTATDNLTKIINEERTDIVFIHEPCNINNMVVGIPTSCTVFTSGAGRKRAAIAIKK
jgi:hypothetical protein